METGAEKFGFLPYWGNNDVLRRERCFLKVTTTINAHLLGDLF